MREGTTRLQRIKPAARSPAPYLDGPCGLHGVNVLLRLHGRLLAVLLGGGPQPGQRLCISLQLHLHGSLLAGANACHLIRHAGHHSVVVGHGEGLHLDLDAVLAAEELVSKVLDLGLRDLEEADLKVGASEKGDTIDVALSTRP